MINTPDIYGAFGISFYPFGMGMPTRSYSSGYSYRLGFNGQEEYDEVKGNSCVVDFENRIYDVRLAKWFSLDRLIHKYPNESPYIFVSNNPIIYMDRDGEDKVYFDESGNEIFREVSISEFEVYVRVADGIEGDIVKVPLAGTFVQAPMPGVVAGYEDPKFQSLDYELAAKVFIFNQNLEKAVINQTIFSKGTELGVTLTEDRYLDISEGVPQELDVNLVKAMLVQESKAGTDDGSSGTGIEDPMQVNNSADYTRDKSIVGLSKGQIMNPSSSISYGLSWLFYKGIEKSGTTDIDSDPYREYYVKTWTDPSGSWLKALEAYNGGGDTNYVEDVMEYYNSIVPANVSNYVVGWSVYAPEESDIIIDLTPIFDDY